MARGWQETSGLAVHLLSGEPGDGIAAAGTPLDHSRSGLLLTAIASLCIPVSPLIHSNTFVTVPHIRFPLLNLVWTVFLD